MKKIVFTVTNNPAAAFNIYGDHIKVRSHERNFTSVIASDVVACVDFDLRKFSLMESQVLDTGGKAPTLVTIGMTRQIFLFGRTKLVFKAARDHLVRGKRKIDACIVEFALETAHDPSGHMKGWRLARIGRRSIRARENPVSRFFSSKQMGIRRPRQQTVYVGGGRLSR